MSEYEVGSVGWLIDQLKDKDPVAPVYMAGCFDDGPRMPDEVTVVETDGWLYPKGVYIENWT